jgi:hypothetical protein
MREKERSPRLTVTEAIVPTAIAPIPKPARSSVTSGTTALRAPSGRMSADSRQMSKSQTDPIERGALHRASDSKSPSKPLPSVAAAKELPRRASSSAVGSSSVRPAVPAKSSSPPPQRTSALPDRKSPVPERKTVVDKSPRDNGTSPRSGAARQQSHALDHLLDEDSSEEKEVRVEEEEHLAEEEDGGHRTSELLMSMEVLEAQIDAMVVSPPAPKHKPPLPPAKK